MHILISSTADASRIVALPPRHRTVTYAIEITMSLPNGKRRSSNKRSSSGRVSMRLKVNSAWLATVCAACVWANDDGPLRDLNWGASPDANAIAFTSFDYPISVATSAALDNSGKLLAGGYTTWPPEFHSEEFVLARIAPAHGALDAGFGSGGRLTLDMGFGIQPSDVAVGPDGRIVYAALFSESSLVIGRLLADGTPDMAFNGNGRRTILKGDFLSLTNAHATALLTPKIVLLPSTKIAVFTTVVGQVESSQAFAFAAATQLNADGSTDTTFGEQGTGYVNYAPDNDGNPQAGASAVVKLSNGEFLLAGAAYHPGGLGSDVMTFRISADGVLDATYGTNGFGFVGFDQGGSFNDGPTDLAIDSAGRAVVLANVATSNDGSRAALARFTADGQLDATFGNGGRALNEVCAAAIWEYGYSITILPDDRILVAGTTSTCANSEPNVGTLTMFTPTGHINPYFGAAGTEHLGDLAGPAAQVLTLTKMFVSGDYAYVVGSAQDPFATGTVDFASSRLIVPLFRSGFESPDVAPQ